MYVIKVNNMFLNYNELVGTIYFSDRFIDPNSENPENWHDATCLFTTMVEASKAICNEEFWFIMSNGWNNIKIDIMKF